MAELQVISVPGLSARMLAEHAARLGALARMAFEGTSATVVVLDGASPLQLERALFTGMLPEFAGARPFWQAGDILAHVVAEHALPAGWHAAEPQARLRWVTQRWFLDEEPAAALGKLDAAVREVVGTLAVLSSRGGNGNQPLERPVLLTRGIEQSKTCVGILEIAGILQRALTGERLTDAI